MEKEQKIKVYRVLKDHLAIGYAHTFTYHPDDLYAYLGYTPFYGQIRRGFANNIGYNQREEGKYFFLFPEDALLCSSTLLYGQCFTFKIVEYEFPVEEVFYNIGFGEYENRSIHHHLVTELTIGESRFTGEKLSSKDIDEESKRQIILKSYDEICELLGENKMKEYFPQHPEAFSEEVEKRLNSRSAKFINHEVELKETKEMTGRSWTVVNFGCNENNFVDVNIEHLANKGLKLDPSKDFERLREDVAYKFGCIGDAPDRAKQMIREYYSSNNKNA